MINMINPAITVAFPGEARKAKPLNVCNNCKWHFFPDPNWGHSCKRKHVSTDIVTGEPFNAPVMESCYTSRGGANGYKENEYEIIAFCRPEGRYFEPKEVTP